MQSDLLIMFRRTLLQVLDRCGLRCARNRVVKLEQFGRQTSKVEGNQYKLYADLNTSQIFAIALLPVLVN